MKIEATRNTPYIKLDKENCTLTIQGKSYPEHPIVFFKPIFDEVRSCLPHMEGTIITINLALEILNSVSSKYLYVLINDINDVAKKVNINWYYEEDDEDMKEEGKIFQSFFQYINLNLISIEDINNLNF